MDTRVFDVIDSPNRAAEFSFQSPNQVNILHKIGWTEGIAVVKNLITDIGSPGSHGNFRGINPQFVNQINRNHNFSSVFG